MAYYLVVARPKREVLDDLRTMLEEGTIVPMKPFGTSLNRSLIGARIRTDGTAIWEELDYCSPPLAAEREAVLDAYFDGIEVTEVQKGEGWSKIRDLPYLFPQPDIRQGEVT